MTRSNMMFVLLFQARTAVKLGSFISGVFGTVGFVLSILAGLASGNTIESILTRGLLCAGICYAVGYCVGMIAQQVAMEHAKHVTDLVAAEDSRVEARDREEQARLDSEAASI